MKDLILVDENGIAIGSTSNKDHGDVIFYQGEQYRLFDLARAFKIKPETLWNRLYKLHWELEDALSRPIQKSNRTKRGTYKRTTNR